ncbi:MAG: hypothetical protein ILP16_03665 [Spirochaetales bacterium]|nr:hypothetical protein [Spirochaetales bacterium]
MRKTALLLIVLLSAAVLFASADQDINPYAPITGNAMRPGYVERTDGLNYILFGNPAAIGESSFMLQIPYIESSSYNVTEALKDPGVAEALSKINKLQATKNDFITYILGLVAASGAGFGEVITVDTGAGAQMRNLAFGMNIRAGVHSMPGLDEEGQFKPSGSVIGNGYVPSLDFALSVAFGFRVLDTDVLTLDAGASFHYAQKAYMLQVTSAELGALLNGSKDFENLPARAGFALPVDIGVTVGLLRDRIRLELTANNLNGTYHMSNYENSINALILAEGTDDFEIEIPYSLNFRASFDPGFRYCNPTLYAAFTGMNLYAENAKGKPGSEIFRYLDGGVIVTFVKSISLRASYRYGYPEFAMGAGIFGNAIELVYGFQEAPGARYGEKPIDRLTFRMRLGFAR